MSALFLVLAAFLASTVEMVEALTIVLAVGVTREWRSTLVGVASALVTVRAGLYPRLKSGDLATHSRGWFAPRRLLVGGQVALSAVLLVAAFLFLQSLANASRMGLGFRPENRLSVSVSPGMQRYTDAEIRRLHVEGLERIRALPGVTSAIAAPAYAGINLAWPLRFLF